MSWNISHVLKEIPLLILLMLKYKPNQPTNMISLTQIQTE